MKEGQQVCKETDSSKKEDKTTKPPPPPKDAIAESEDKTTKPPPPPKDAVAESEDKTQEPFSSSLPECEGSPMTDDYSFTSKWTDCQGTYRWPGEDKYVGEWKDGKKHGQGTLVYYSDGKAIKGIWKDGYLARGTLTCKGLGEGGFSDVFFGAIWKGEFPDVLKYSKDFKFPLQKGKPNPWYGQGSLIFPNGDQFVGEASIGPWGTSCSPKQGTYTCADGTQFTGTWGGRGLDGKGTFTYPDGTQYISEWYNDKQREYLSSSMSGYRVFAEHWGGGHGIWVYPNGEKYAGREHVKHPQTKKFCSLGMLPGYTTLNSYEYSGEFKNGQFNGQGIYSTQRLKAEDLSIMYEPTEYVGEFKDGKKHGQGVWTHIYEDLTLHEVRRTKYVGEYKNGLRHGQGTQGNGKKYVGQWKDGKQHGQGTYTYADGKKYIGKWKDNKRHGKGAEVYSDGKVVKGIWKNDELFEVQ
jgi:hypothetical protein